jgi:hypothetical protein
MSDLRGSMTLQGSKSGKLHFSIFLHLYSFTDLFYSFVHLTLSLFNEMDGMIQIKGSCQNGPQMTDN